MKKPFSAAVSSGSILDQIRVMQPEAVHLLLTNGIDNDDLVQFVREQVGAITIASPDMSTYNEQLMAVYALGIAIGHLTRPELLRQS